MKNKKIGFNIQKQLIVSQYAALRLVLKVCMAIRRRRSFLMVCVAIPGAVCGN